MNKIKKLTSWLMIGVMLAGITPIKTFADAQYQVQDLFVSEISHTNKSGGDIIPTVRVEWNEPKLGEEGHRPTYYQFEVIDLLDKNTTLLSEVLNVDVNNSSLADNIGNYYFGADTLGNIGEGASRLGNGTFYKVSVVPRHTHKKDDGTIEVSPEVGIKEYEYVITDFDTKMADSEDGLDIIWEYIDGATYELVYIEGDYDSKHDILGDSTGDTPKVSKVITDKEARNMLFTENGKKKVRYTIRNTKPGQMYSAYVEVTDLRNSKYTGSFADIRINDADDKNGPKVVKGIPEILINIQDINSELIKLSWKNNSWTVINDRLKKVVVYGAEDNTNEFKLLASKNNDTSATIDSIIVDKPKLDTKYYVDFVFEDSYGNEYTIKSKIVTYIIDYIKDIPLKPIIPKPWGEDTVINSEEDRKNYLVAGDDTEITNSKLKDRTFTSIVGEDTKIQLVWGSQNKPNTNEVDFDLLYDIWVSDSDLLMHNTSFIKPILKDLKIDEGDRDKVLYTHKDNKPIGFRWLLDSYTTRDGKTHKIDNNKTYYIALQAKRKYKDSIEKSNVEVVSITVDKYGNIHKPQVMSKPPLSVTDITSTSFKIQWKNAWIDVLAKNPSAFSEEEKALASIGSNRIFVEDSKTLPIRFTSNNNRKEVVLHSKSDLAKLKNEIGQDIFEASYYERETKLEEDIKYEFKLMKYSDVTNSLNGQLLEEWVLYNQGESTDGWSEITPYEFEDNNRHYLRYDINNLEPNTRYIVLLRAYRNTVEGEKLIQSYPNYIICNTLDEFTGKPPKPVVPTLQLDYISDIEAGVWWEYNKDFEYEIVYSTHDDVNNATKVEFTISTNPMDDNYVECGGKAEVAIKGLMPSTSYNVWIRAKQRNGEEVSEWSNPLRIRTEELDTPDKPRGLGLASKDSLNDLDREDKPLSSDYMIIEWIRDRKDTGEVVEENLERSYEYIVEFANNDEFSDAIHVVTTDKDSKTQEDIEILRKDIVKFGGLQANTEYYIRVKTRVIVKDNSLDREVSKESDFSDVIKIATLPSDDEYDGGANENIVTFDKDIEETYSSRKWTWEIKNTQKIISDIVDSNNNYYEIDMELYKDRYEADKRLIRIPHNVMVALYNQNMTIRILTESGKFDIEAKAIESVVKSSIKDDIVEFAITQVQDYEIMDKLKNYPYSFSSGERLEIRVVGKEPLMILDKPIKVSRILVNNTDKPNNVECYVYSNEWIQCKSQTETLKGKRYLVFETQELGLYGKYTLMKTVSSNVSHEMQAIKERYGILSIGDKHNGYTKVHSNLYINLMLGIANGSESIQLGKVVTNEDKQKALNSGIYTDYSGWITKEQALSGVVKLYEISNGYKVQAGNVQVYGASNKYSKELSKAYTLGIINQGESLNPKEGVGLRELCLWLYRAGF